MAVHFPDMMHFAVSGSQSGRWSRDGRLGAIGDP